MVSEMTLPRPDPKERPMKFVITDTHIDIAYQGIWYSMPEDIAQMPKPTRIRLASDIAKRDIANRIEAITDQLQGKD